MDTNIKKENGAVLVEFTLVLGLLLFIFTGIFDLGYAIQRVNLATESARHGLRSQLGASQLECGAADLSIANASTEAFLQSAGENLSDWSIQLSVFTDGYDISPRNGVGGTTPPELLTGQDFIRLRVQLLSSARGCLFCFSRIVFRPDIELSYPLCRREV